MRNQTNAKRRKHGIQSTGKEEWNDGNESADGGGNARREGGRPVIWEPMLGQTELALRHRLNKLLRLLGQALRHSLRFFGTESLQLIEERHFFDFFLRILFDLGALAG